jgi:hypothetical protein
MNPTRSRIFLAGTGPDGAVDDHESLAEAGPPEDGDPTGRADDPSGGWTGTPKRTLLLFVAVVFLTVLALALFLAAVSLA